MINLERRGGLSLFGENEEAGFASVTKGKTEHDWGKITCF